ncbi:MAG: hypothetical protein ABI743_11890, partial [bacterium]
MHSSTRCCTGLALMLGLLAGCAGTGPTIPPAAANDALTLAPTASGLPLGVAHVRVDSVTGAVEVSPLRLNSAIGDAYL